MRYIMNEKSSTVSELSFLKKENEKVETVPHRFTPAYKTSAVHHCNRARVWVLRHRPRLLRLFFFFFTMPYVNKADINKRPMSIKVLRLFWWTHRRKMLPAPLLASASSGTTPEQWL